MIFEGTRNEDNIGKLTNRRSRGPCKTDAVTVDNFVSGDRCLCSIPCSMTAEGAIATADVVGVGFAWDFL